MALHRQLADFLEYSRNPFSILLQHLGEQHLDNGARTPKRHLASHAVCSLACVTQPCEGARVSRYDIGLRSDISSNFLTHLPDSLTLLSLIESLYVWTRWLAANEAAPLVQCVPLRVLLQNCFSKRFAAPSTRPSPSP